MNLTARARPGRTAPSWGQAESEYLQSCLTAMHLDATVEQMAQLQAYARLLLKWNRTYNLLGATTAKDLIASHLLDSLATLPVIRRWLQLSGSSPAADAMLLDVGSGAGLPGLPLAIMLPDLPIGLVEPIGKRTAFLRQSIAQLGLPRVRLWEARIENLELSGGLRPAQGLQPGQNTQATPHFICRAFTSLADFTRACAPYAIEGSLLFAMKASRVAEEIAQLPAFVEVLAVEPLLTIEDKMHRNLVVMRLYRSHTMPHPGQG